MTEKKSLIDPSTLEKLRTKFDEKNAEKNKILKAENEAQRTVEEEIKEKKLYFDSYLHEKKPQSQEAAKLILEWVNEFITSDVFKHIATPGKHIRISNVSSSPIWWYTKTIPKIQYFYLNCKGNLYVHNDERYGKSHLIETIDDALAHAGINLLSDTADSIRDDYIVVIITNHIE